MDHPEKELFEQVKALRNKIEESRDRIFKVEATYIEKVENSEKRQMREKRLDEKLKDFKQAQVDKKEIIIDNKNFTIFKKTVFENIYKSPKLMEFFDNKESFINYEMDYDYFFAIYHIVQKGHNIFLLDDEDKSSLEKNFTFHNSYLAKDPIFNRFIKEFFEAESFKLVCLHFNLNYSCIPEKLTDLISSISFTNGNKYSNDTLTKHFIKESEEKDYQSLTDKDEKSTKAIFLDYNGEVIITLKESVRCKSLILRPFTQDTYNFSPTSGSYYTKCFVGDSTENMSLVSALPSTYGSVTDDYMTTLNLTGYKSFKYIKFKCDNSSQFSINYIGFK